MVGDTSRAGPLRVPTVAPGRCACAVSEYPGRELNPHARRHRGLSATRLPITSPGQDDRDAVPPPLGAVGQPGRGRPCPSTSDGTLSARHQPRLRHVRPGSPPAAHRASFVSREGLEPSRPCGHWPLRPACLPFHHQDRRAGRSRRGVHTTHRSGAGPLLVVAVRRAAVRCRRAGDEQPW